MDLDATINSHPIIQPVEHPDQITEIFDTISYSKGAAVLRYFLIDAFKLKCKSVYLNKQIEQKSMTKGSNRCKMMKILKFISNMRLNLIKK
jgi:glutamyl aminopeptidase